MNNIEKGLLETMAIKIADSNHPYWYTSGTIGPFFINTHYLYGSKDDAEELLNYIDSEKQTTNFFVNLENRVCSFYDKNKVFKTIVDEFYDGLKKTPEFIGADIVSGGERRDWFFSPIIAKLSGKKHLYILKDNSLYSNEINDAHKSIGGAKIAHIADLITQASSYQRAWIPSIVQAGAKIVFSAALVDRCQGGVVFLESNNIKTYCSVKIDKILFDKLLDSELISKPQYEMILSFLKDPDGYGKSFLNTNPDFIKQSYNEISNQKKVKIFFESNPYKLSDISKYKVD